MIYVIWKDANFNVLHGWDVCDPAVDNRVDYKDSPVIHGPVEAEQNSEPQVVNISISKFPGAESEPTQPITNCKFYISPFYDSSGVTYSIPTGYSAYAFCDDETDKVYAGYSGSNSATEDYQTLAVEWPAMTPSCGLFISQDQLCSWTVFEDGEGIDLKASAGGSATYTDGELSPGYTAQIGFRVTAPAAEDLPDSLSTLCVLTKMEYTFTE